MTIVNRDQLLESAQDFGVRALQAYLDDDKRVVLTHAAFATEHLLKAYLADINPAYLQDLRGNSFDSLLHLTGYGSKAKKLKSPRTISAREALSRVEHFLPGLAGPKDKLHLLVEVRDAVAHAGHLDKADNREIFVAFLRCSSDLYDALHVSPEDRWAGHQQDVSDMISETLSEIERAVKQRLAAARLKINKLLANFPKDQHVSLMAARQSRLRILHPGYEMFSVKCPACGDESATYIGGYDDVALRDDEGAADGDVYGMHLIFIADSFVCGACELTLHGSDELKAADLEAILDLGELEVSPYEGDPSLLWNEF